MVQEDKSGGIVDKIDPGKSVVETANARMEMQYHSRQFGQGRPCHNKRGEPMVGGRFGFVVRLLAQPRRLPVVFFGALLAGCATTGQTPSAQGVTRAATIVSVGADQVGLLSGPQPVAYLDRIDHETVSRNAWGLPVGTVTTGPGDRELFVQCLMDAGALRGTPKPFAPLANGTGIVNGQGGSAVARIRLATHLQANKTYELRCEAIGDYLARAWLSERP